MSGPEDDGAIDATEDRLFDRLVDDVGTDAGAALSGALLAALVAAPDEAALRQLLDGDALTMIDERPLASSLENALFAVRAAAELVR